MTQVAKDAKDDFSTSDCTSFLLDKYKANIANLFEASGFIWFFKMTDLLYPF
jgi:hypothetical protein